MLFRSEYLVFSRHLFEENYLYKSGAVIWASDNANYDFGYDSIPKISFKKLNLTCYAKGDSSVIYETSGTYYPTIFLWTGQGGTLKWTRAGFDEKQVFAIIPAYEIDAQKTEFEIDSVTFYNRNFFGDQALHGKITEKVIAIASKTGISYPRFESYNKTITLKNIESGVDYVGGFAMHGERFVGRGTQEKPVSIVIYRNNKPFVKALAINFIITVEHIVADNAAIRIYLENDSIYHPGLQFRYFREKREVVMIRDRMGMSRSSFYDNFHKVDIDVEQVSWKVGDEEMHFTNLLGTTNKYALFESSNFFNAERYYDIQGMADQSPLVIIRNLTVKMDTTFLTVEALASAMRISIDQIRLDRKASCRERVSHTV